MSEKSIYEKIDYLFDRINWKKSFLDAEAAQIMNDLKNDIQKNHDQALVYGYTRAYKQGFIDGLTAYAHNKDGTQHVGTTGKTLKDAIDQVEQTWNFKK